MRKFAARVFSGYIDLGTGAFSPIDVDYRCPESLSQQKFMQKLLGLTDQIHGDDGPRACHGTVVYSLWRDYAFSLTKAGFSPRMLSQNPSSARRGMDWKSLTRADGAHETNRVFRYFKQWSEKSQFNLGQYADFTAEFDRVLPLLAQHYEQKLRLP